MFLVFKERKQQSAFWLIAAVAETSQVKITWLVS